MSLQIKVKGVKIDRCTQSALFASGTNSITQRSIWKQNLGVTLSGSGQVWMENDTLGIVDPDQVESGTWEGENWADSPS